MAGKKKMMILDDDNSVLESCLMGEKNICFEKKNCQDIK